MNGFTPIEQVFPNWPTVRADIEPLVPDRPVFIQDLANRNVISLDQSWAMQMLARAPDQASFDFLKSRIEYLGKVNQSVLVSCRLDDFHGLAIDERTLHAVNQRVVDLDNERKRDQHPTFRALALECLGLKPANRYMSFEQEVKR